MRPPRKPAGTGKRRRAAPGKATGAKAAAAKAAPAASAAGAETSRARRAEAPAARPSMRRKAFHTGWPLAAIGAMALASGNPLAPSETTTPGAIPVAGATNCGQFYEGGTPPVFTIPAGAAPGREFCHIDYVAFYSTSLRDPLWSAEHLTRAAVEQGKGVTRIASSFLQQKGLDAADQGSDANYANATFDGVRLDRGHMTPANDAPTVESQKDTFVVTNIVPQTASLNERLWASLEGSVLALAEQQGEAYVVTGPVFGAQPPLMAKRIAIPVSTFKAIYVPSLNVAVAYVATNQAAPVCHVVSIAVLTAQTGLDPFPAVAANVKSATPSLALPPGVRVVGGKPQSLAPPNCA